MPKKDADPFSCFQMADGRWKAVAQTKDKLGKVRPKPIERKTEELARQAMRDFLRENLRLNPRPGMSVDAMLEAYNLRCEKKGRAESTLKDYRRYRRLFKESIGHIAVEKLMPAHIEAALDEFNGTKDAGNARSYLRAAINKIARKADPNLPNVAELSEPPDHEPGTPEKLTEARLDLILSKESEGWRKALWLLYAGTGIRPTEGRTLMWPEIEEREDGMWIRKVDAKTPTGKKPVPVPPAVAIALRTVPKQGVFVFPSPRSGRPFDESTIREYWAAAVESAGLPEITLYQLRHLFGTVTARKVKDHILARLMRHTDPRTSKQYYVDEEEPELRKAIEG